MVLRIAAAGLVSLIVLVSAGLMSQSRAEAPIMPDPVVIDAKEGRPVESVGREIIALLAKQDFDHVYDSYPDWRIQANSDMSPIQVWRLENGWEPWEHGLRERVQEFDPKSKSGLDTKENFIKGTDARRIALFVGLYKIYGNEEWELRLTSPWALGGRNLKYEPGNTGTAVLTYGNRYNDSIELTLSREGSGWCLMYLKINMPKEMPRKPKTE